MENDLRRWMRLVEEALKEAVSDQDMTFYHGTDSAPFVRYDHALAAKGPSKWNPLGSGMYATNSRRFAANFGRHVHKVVLPVGSSYRKITQRQWGSLGLRIVEKALESVFKTNPPMAKQEMGKMKWSMSYVLGANSPFDSLLGCYQIVENSLGADAAKTFSDAVPKISDRMFSKYDFVIFTDTINSNPEYDELGKQIKAWEVVIFNKTLQKVG